MSQFMTETLERRKLRLQLDMPSDIYTLYMPRETGGKTPRGRRQKLLVMPVCVSFIRQTGD